MPLLPLQQTSARWTPGNRYAVYRQMDNPPPFKRETKQGALEVHLLATGRLFPVDRPTRLWFLSCYCMFGRSPKLIRRYAPLPPPLVAVLELRPVEVASTSSDRISPCSSMLAMCQGGREDLLPGLSVHRLGPGFRDCFRRCAAGSAGVYGLRDHCLWPGVPVGADEASLSG